MRTYFLLAVLSILTLSSCKVRKTLTSKSIDIYSSGVIHNPVIVDLEVKNEKISAILKRTSRMPLSEIKAEAVYNAVSNNKADVLIEPVFQTETKGGITTVIVTGYAGFYKNFRSMTPEDIRILETVGQKQAEIVTPVNIKRKRSQQ